MRRMGTQWMVGRFGQGRAQVQRGFCLALSTAALSIVSLCAAVLAMAMWTPVPSQAGTPCVEAVFFDLGNTLIEDNGSGTFELRVGAAQTVSDLQDAGIRLGIITNVPGSWDIDDLRAIMAEPEFLDEFEVVILSSEAPASKPNPAIYIFAHEALAAPRPPITSAAFVGETLSEIANAEVDPTLGARSVGMIGIHLSDAPPSPLTDYTIPTDDLGQVVSIVDETCGSADVGFGHVSSTSSSRIFAPKPNPSSGNSRISFNVAAPGDAQSVHTRVGIYDAQGRNLAVLLDRVLSAGRHEVVWDGRTDGEPVSSGVYFARLQTDRHVQQVPVLRIK